jgi:hypothetical protein
MTAWFALGSIRVNVERFEGGWGWHTWEALTADGWQPLPVPAVDNACRRFGSPQHAARFLLSLAHVIVETEAAAPPSSHPAPATPAVVTTARR